MTFTGTAEGYETPYHIEGEGAFYHKKRYESIAHPSVCPYRNLSEGNPEKGLVFNKSADYRI